MTGEFNEVYILCSQAKAKAELAIPSNPDASLLYCVRKRCWAGVGVGTDYSRSSPSASPSFSNIFNLAVSTSTFLLAFFFPP